VPPRDWGWGGTWDGRANDRCESADILFPVALPLTAKLVLSTLQNPFRAPLVLPLFFLACFVYNCVLFMENPEVKWKQFVFIPGGSRVEAISCSCQTPVCSWAFVLLPFYPPTLLLPGTKPTPTWWMVCLEITEDGLWAFSHTAFCGAWGERGHLSVGRSCPWLCHSRVLPSDLCSYNRDFGNCTYLCSERLSQQLLVFHDYLSEVFKNDSDATISSQDWLQTVFPIGNRLPL